LSRSDDASWSGPLLFGHRGAPGAGLAENTIASFERALADGAHALETDAHRSADGHIVLSHDADLSRVFGSPLVIRDCSLAELQAVAPIPTLADLLTRFPDVPVNIDLKQREPPMEATVLKTIDDHDAASRVLLASFHAAVLRRVRALGYRGPTGLARDEIARLVALPGLALRVWPLGGARAQVPRRSGRVRFDTRTFIDKCHRLGVRVDYWTINDLDEARALLALGADGIMSDVPGIVAEAFKEERLRTASAASS
jgi:glycerophosphoryl diester phosphodiesterase